MVRNILNQGLILSLLIYDYIRNVISLLILSIKNKPNLIYSGQMGFLELEIRMIIKYSVNYYEYAEF